MPSDDARYKLLVKILTSNWLIAPGTDLIGELDERVTMHMYDTDRKLSDPEGLFLCSAVCFCDIPVADLGVHVRKYGPFGLSFRKAFLIAKGAAPVFYWPNGVRIKGDTRAKWLDALAEEILHLQSRPGAKRPKGSKLERFFDELVLPYLKPFDETRADGDPDNYYMEREWRTLTSIRFELSDVYRVILPQFYSHRFRRDVPMYSGQVTFTDTRLGRDKRPRPRLAP